MNEKARSSSHIGRIPELDGIRAIAILLVIGCHYEGFCRGLGRAPVIGWIGVDIFFVLSGYLITSILLQLRGTKSPFLTFYTRRILRIFPVYYATLLFVSCVSLLCHEHMVHLRYLASRFLFLQSLVDSPSILNKAFHAAVHSDPNPALFLRTELPFAVDGIRCGPWAQTLGVAWSLSVEEYFYVLWAPVVLLFKKTRAVGFVAISVVGLSIAVQYLGFGGVTDYFNFLCRMHTIMAGALVALYMNWRGKRLNDRKILDRSAVILAALSFVVLILVLLWNRPIFARELRDSPSFMVFGLPAISILFSFSLVCVLDRSGNAHVLLRVLRLRPLRQLGVVSYSLYLFHVPVYQFMELITASCGNRSNVMQWGISIASLAISITLSLMSWKFVESPILKLKDRWAPVN